MVKKESSEPVVSHKEEKKERFFPLFTILYGIVLLVIAGVLYFQIYQIPPFAIVVLLALAGLLILKLSFETGFEHKRKAILKKYL